MAPHFSLSDRFVAAALLEPSAGRIPGQRFHPDHFSPAMRNILGRDADIVHEEKKQIDRRTRLELGRVTSKTVQEIIARLTVRPFEEVQQEREAEVLRDAMASALRGGFMM